MKLEFKPEHYENVNGTNMNVIVKVIAKSDDEVVTILERDLVYNVNTATEGWREEAVIEFEKQASKFKTDAEGLLTSTNAIKNISNEVASVMADGA